MPNFPHFCIELGFGDGHSLIDFVVNKKEF